MTRSIRRRFQKAAIATAAGTVFAIGGCADFFTPLALDSFDFCSVFNCSGGTFFNFCEPGTLFVDCPQATVEQE